MSWESLGVLSPSLNWQSFPALASISQTFRVIQSFSSPSPGPALICQWFESQSPPSRATIRKIYATVENASSIILLPIPPDLKVAGIVSRAIQLKLGRFPHFDLENWQIEIQVFMP